jgi:hypothetical protein
VSIAVRGNRMVKRISLAVTTVMLANLASGCVGMNTGLRFGRLPAAPSVPAPLLAPLPRLGDSPFGFTRATGPATQLAIGQVGTPASFVCRTDQDCLNQLEGSNWACQRDETYSTGTCVSPYQSSVDSPSSSPSVNQGGGEINWFVVGALTVGAVVALVALDRAIAQNCNDGSC